MMRIAMVSVDVVGVEAIRVHARRAWLQFRDAFDELVPFATQCIELLAHCERFEQQRAARARGRDDEDGALEASSKAFRRPWPSV